MQALESPYFAAVDLGSNSFHMLVARANGEKIDIVDREKEMVQIARGLKPLDGLNHDAQQRAIACLRRFSERLRGIPNAQIRAVGTKALRSAKNASNFLKLAEDALGVPVQIISGFEEARLVYTGLSHTITNDQNQRLVVDIGGGSTEFIIGKGVKPSQLESLPLGCVTFSDHFFTQEPQLGSSVMREAYLAACTELEKIQRNFLKSGWDIAYGTSGTIRAIASLLEHRDGGTIITRQSLLQLIEETIADGRIIQTNISSPRREVLPAGLAILQAIFDQLKLEQMRVADATLKEGLIYDTIGRYSNRDSRQQTVANLTQQYNIDTEQAQRVTRCALHFWQQINDQHRIPGISRSRILTWAAQLHEIGLDISHTGIHHHGYYLIKNSDLAGFGRYEQHLLAKLVHCHRKKLNASRLDNLDEKILPVFTNLLVCLRLSVLLHRRREDLDTTPQLSVAPPCFCLNFDSDWLTQHPLTQAGLELEREQLQQIGLQLTINNGKYHDT